MPIFIIAILIIRTAIRAADWLGLATAEFRPPTTDSAER
jgi:hypothetical protein